MVKLSLDDIQFLPLEGGLREKDFKQIALSLFSKKNIRQKTDLSKKEIVSLVYLEIVNEEIKKELRITSDFIETDEGRELTNPTIIELFISFFTQYKVSTSRKGRNELVNSFMSQIEKKKEQTTIKQEII